MSPLSESEAAVIEQLRAEIADLDIGADTKWAAALAALKKGDDEEAHRLFGEANADMGEADMKWLIAHIPTRGERKVAKVQKLIQRATKRGDVKVAAKWQARLSALESINEWRESLGLKPLDRIPQGILGDAQECALARAFKTDFNSHRELQEVSVGGDTAEIRWYDSRDRSYHHDVLNSAYDAAEAQHTDPGRLYVEQMDNFVTAFDQVRYLDLILDESLVGTFHTFLEGDIDEYDRYDRAHVQEWLDEFKRRDRLGDAIEVLKGEQFEGAYEWDEDGTNVRVMVTIYDED